MFGTVSYMVMSKCILLLNITETRKVESSDTCSGNSIPEELNGGIYLQCKNVH